MNNLISRQNAIYTIDKYISGFDVIDVNFLDGLKTAKKLIKELPSAWPEWIPVTERLPRDDEEVIVTCLDDSGDTPYSYTTVAWHYQGMWVCDNMRCPFVIAWLPRPKPWRGEKHEL